MMDSYSPSVSSAFFLRDQEKVSREELGMVKVGKESSRRDQATGVRTVVEVGCFLMDAALVLAGHLAGFWVRFYSGWATGPIFTDTEKIPTVGGYLSHFVLGGILFSILLVRAGAYRRNALLRRQTAFQALSKAAFQWVLLYLLVSLFFKLDPPIARTFVLISGLLIIPLLFLGRMMLLRALHRSVWGDRLRTRLLVVGWNEQARELAQAQSHRDSIHPVHLVGWVPLPGQKVNPHGGQKVPQLGELADVENLLVTGDFDGVLLADVSADPKEIARLRDTCCRENADFLVVPNVFEGLRTYLTTGPKESRAWTIHAGDRAPQAAGVIHTDFERGFIAAETVAFADLKAAGTMGKVREAGKLRVEGKEYVVQDGDVMEFRFNV